MMPSQRKFKRTLCTLFLPSNYTFVGVCVRIEKRLRMSTNLQQILTDVCVSASEAVCWCLLKRTIESGFI